MGTYRGLQFTATHENLIRKNRTAAGKHTAAVVDTLNWASKKIFNYVINSRLNLELDLLFPQIMKALGKDKVVLVVVQYQQWRTQYASGDNLDFIHSAYIGASGNDRTLAYRIFKIQQNMPLLKRAPDANMVYSRKVFLWFEKKLLEDEKKQYQEVKKRRNLNLESAR